MGRGEEEDEGRRRRREYQKGQQQLTCDVEDHRRWTEQAGISSESPSLGAMALHSFPASPFYNFHLELAKQIEIGLSSILLIKRQIFARVGLFAAQLSSGQTPQADTDISPAERWS